MIGSSKHMVSGPHSHLAASDSVGRLAHIPAGGSVGALFSGGVLGGHGVVVRKDWSLK